MILNLIAFCCVIIAISLVAIPTIVCELMRKQITMIERHNHAYERNEFHRRELLNKIHDYNVSLNPKVPDFIGEIDKGEITFGNDTEYSNFETLKNSHAEHVAELKQTIDFLKAQISRIEDEDDKKS